MNLAESSAKPLLAAAGIPVPRGAVVRTPEEAECAARDIGPCAVKAQVPAGGRGKAGGIRLAETPAEAATAAAGILGMEIGGHAVDELLIEAQARVGRECYCAAMVDPGSRAPVVLFTLAGGVDVESATEADPSLIRRAVVDVSRGFGILEAKVLLDGLDLGGAEAAVARALAGLFRVFRAHDAELVEINPLGIASGGGVVAMDCKFVLDDGSAPRQPEIAALAVPERATELETRAGSAGLKYIELDGAVGILANGAGLTMTTMDAVSHFGGMPANFLEIGGEAYTKAKPALEIVLANPRVRALVVNFCGAFARTDVMTAGVVEAWKELKPEVPVFFSISGTGEAEAIALVRRELAIEPLATMDDAVRAAVAAAGES